MWKATITTFLVAITLFSKAHGNCDNNNPCLFVENGTTLQAPDQLTSSGGTLSITLEVNIAEVQFDWLTVKRRAYNGKIPGPTWRVKRGDVVTVTLINRLTTPQKQEAFNQQRYPNSTNLHTHGLHISSADPQDNVFKHVNPGETYTYTYQIDSENPAGTLWYHPHLHGSTAFQVTGGLAGMLIVEDPLTGNAAMPEGLASVSCPNNCAHEVELLFQPCLSNGNRGYSSLQDDIEDDSEFRLNNIQVAGGGTLEQWLETNTDIYTTNGQVYPTLDMTTGQIKRFRMVNAAGSATLELLITDETTTTATTGCVFKEIAFDGIYLDSARDANLGKTFLPPASKGDWLVVCNTAGRYRVQSVADPADQQSIGDFDRYNGVLLYITVTGSATTTTIPTALPARESFANDFSNLSQEEVEGRYVIEVNTGTQLNRAIFSDASHYRFRSSLGSVQEWYFTNTDRNMGHPIHIHINHFQVISYNPYTGPIGIQQGGLIMLAQDGTVCDLQSAGYVDNGQTVRLPPNSLQYLGHDTRASSGGAGTLGYVQPGEFRDIMIVPPLSNITIRFMAHKFTGNVVIHCHILVHEDAGMMMSTEIVDEALTESSALTEYSKSGNAYPGQCGECDPFPFNQVVSNCPAASSSEANTNKNLMYLLFLQVVPIVIGRLLI